MPGEPVVGRAGVGRRRRAVVAERVIAGQRAADKAAGRIAQRRHIAQVVAVGVVQRPRRAHGHHLPGKAVGRARRHRPAVRHLALVVGEGGIDARRHCPIRLVDGQNPLAVGVVFGCSGARKAFSKKVKNTCKVASPPVQFVLLFSELRLTCELSGKFGPPILWTRVVLRGKET